MTTVLASASTAESLASLSEATRSAILADLSNEDLAHLEYDWRFWARPNQIAPDWSWQTWLALAGRGFGKTEAGAQWVRERVASGARSIALLAETQKDLEEVMVARLIAIHPPKEAPSVRYKPVRLVWPNGAVALGYNGTEPDQLRGPEFDTAWVDELAKYRYARETWDMLQFTMRRGNDPRVFVTTTPRPIPVIREILADKTTAVSRGSTFDNAKNLPVQFLANLKERYAGTRLGRQELDAEVLDDVSGALWSRLDLEKALLVGALPDMQRVVVGVDPSGTSGESDGGDAIGIVAAGKGVDGRAYVLADFSCKLSPDGWGKRAVSAYRDHNADRIVGEANFGGAMVEHVIRTVDRSVSYKKVTASRGKVVRAEPIAALYEQGRVSHVRGLGDLEDQMCLEEGTLVETARGQIPIEKVTDQDQVMTRKGFAPVSWAGYTGRTSRLIEIETDRSVLRVTSCHPVYQAQTGEFVSAGLVKASDSLLESPRWESMAPQRPGEDVGITGCRRVTTVTQKASYFIARSMKLMLGVFRQASTFIISTAIPRTTRLQTCGRLPDQSTRQSIAGLASMNSWSGRLFSARSAGKLLRRSGQIEQNTAAIVALRERIGVEKPVYNLSVEPGFSPEFFANGVLVHNCSMTGDGYMGEGSPDRVDAMVWALTDLMLEPPAEASFGRYHVRR